MKYKLMCTDMDGTLLNGNHEISRESIEVIKKAHDKGVKIAVCTGRLHSSAFYFANLLGINAPVISSNGAFIREKDRDKVIYKKTIDKNSLQEILKVCKEYNLNPYFHTPNRVMGEKEMHSAKIYMDFNKHLPKEEKIHIDIIKEDQWDEIFEKYKHEIVKAIVIEDKNSKALKYAKDKLKKVEQLEVVSSMSNNFEIMNREVSKGRAVETLAKYYNISKDEIICIGDNENDISMIKYAGLGIAMENGCDEIKKVAQYITDTNINDGVAKVIKKFILNSKAYENK
ncbi:Cof-type HAD-IIB family hydrolase [Clostridium frigidicarnis]|uniref:Cof subfamily of IIB subfamily of haloacid dehalogenase superfamily/HAD-superfamily hydrolase, subfamily IIB n=1 Tax=Clostridium frigidicarnis TaxID=84698 RepID=A0A1I0ZU98_9CLOT|nr:Cof-type HAD-IIB family hydrolase [Clostridium frigidicarnis]SFB27898.1 hypothetical protein SAMN04488528_10247 [Clostridium frigidicarnis]